jgi:hypothetical protein
MEFEHGDPTLASYYLPPIPADVQDRDAVIPIAAYDPVHHVEAAEPHVSLRWGRLNRPLSGHERRGIQYSAHSSKFTKVLFRLLISAFCNRTASYVLHNSYLVVYLV